ncbi:DUF6090 family protein [Chryseobacterium koreense]|uniref:DUF6090 family protein n=1 Tax=Chryseobacterium koreense TaxID=232216 RepID=UPI0026F234BD|nr:DUF6090 family protein [Chryseobacterium koreense]
MAELEVVKSTKKIITTAKSKDESFWNKFKKISTEILIIMFAVSLSIGLHSWSETRHQQQEVKIFLTGLRKDLKKDREEMNSDISSYENQRKAFRYLANLEKGQSANRDSMKVYADDLKTFTGFMGNTGRYEGFKSSGKILFIEDNELQNNILDLYEESIPVLTQGTNFYKNEKLKLNDFIIERTTDFPNGNLAMVLGSDPVKNRSNMYLASVAHIIVYYKDCLSKIDEIIKGIDSHYPENNQ